MVRSMIKVGEIELFLRDSGGGGPAILCVHGRWGRGETWSDFMGRYGGTYRVLAPDLRGHGLSSRPLARYTAEEYAGDLLGLLDALKIERAILVGHSMGAHAAAWLAAKHPERVAGLALLDKSAAGPSRGSSLPPEEIEAVDPISKDWNLPFPSLAEARARIRADMDSELSSEYFLNSLREEVGGYGMMYSAQAIAANIAYYESWFELLPQIRCPVMLLRAKGGAAVKDEDFRRMRELLPGCLAFESSQTDHNVHLSDKAEFYAFFERFLALVEA